jgi:diguanylate cyclase (GGDEF)-like protein
VYLSKLLVLITAFFLLCVSSVCASQNYAQQLQRISTDEGLSQSYVLKSLQDDIGYVWIATIQGLNRYDGYEIKTFSGGFGLDQHSINLLFKTQSGKIIVSTYMTGAYIIDPSTLKTEKIYSGSLDKEQSKFSPIGAITQNQNIIYFAIDGQVFTFDNNTKKLDFKVAIPTENDFIRTLKIHKNTLFIGTNSGLYSSNLYNYTLKKITLHPPEKVTRDNVNVKFLTVDNTLGLLVGTVEGMYRIAFDNNKYIDLLNITTLIPNYNIWDYTNTLYGEFVATEKGLFQYHRETEQLEFILSFDKSKFNVSENSIEDLMVDKSGVLWLASRTQGIFTWATQTRRFKRVTLPGNNIINKVHQDKNNILWLGTDNGITSYNQITKKSTPYLRSNDEKSVYGEFSIYDIFPSQLQNEQFLWLVTYSGLKLFDKFTGAFIDNKDIEKGPISRDDLFGFAQVAPDTFAYISSDDFYVFNANTGKNRIIKGLKQKTDPLLAYTFHSPLKTHPDEFILSTPKYLYRYNEKTQKLITLFESVNSKDDLFYTVENVYLDTKHNVLWLATTQEGLIGVDPKTYQQKHYIGLKNALNTDSIYTLLPDNNGFLWISTNNGLYQLNLETLEVTSYSVKDGLSINQFGAIAATTLHDGRLAFGSNYGALIFDPLDFVKKELFTSKNTLEITDVNLFSKSLNYYPNQYSHTPLMLSHDDMGLTISFSNFDYSNIDRTYYKVMLSGPTSLSYNDLKSNKVFFTKLPPGDYSLTVSASFRDRENISKPSTFNFNVAYHPWLSPRAYTVYVIIITTILFLLFWQYRSRQVAIENAHRATIQSQKQTELALINNKSGIWDYHFSDNTFSTQRSHELGYSNLSARITLKRFFELIHPEDKLRIETQWFAYIQQNQQKHWQATYRLRHKNGHWMWYQDSGQIIYTQHTHEPLYVSGIYTNITEQRGNEQQAMILGEAFSQINDSLLILDAQLIPFSANNSFINTFSSSEAISKLTAKLFIKAMGKQKCKKLAAKLKSLKPKENWRTDAYVNITKNKNHPIHLSVTAIADEHNDINYYVVVITDLTEQKQAENELRYLANYDPLTRLPNRSLMYKKIETAIQHANSNNTQCAVLFIDLDKFKPVNDSFGHDVGDKLLCDITQRVSATLGENATLGRQSGDEFLVLIENLDSVQLLSDTVREMGSELAKKVIIDDFSINISASIGVALYPFDALTTDILIRNADVAMMQAKQAGRNGFKYFSEEMNEQIKQKLILENDLKDATKDNLLFNHYQPIIDINAKTITGVELLMRWSNKGKTVSPAQFIPIAEDAGLIEALTEQALKRALIELSPVLSSNPLFYISLNLSPKHILKANITEQLVSILEESQIDPIQLRLEITESTLLEDKIEAAKQLQRLKNAGFKLLLDDFGTGYSSLTYLSQFPINVIKIDQSFVSSIGIDRGDESIIKTIHSLAQNLELYCIAEGVETREQMLFLAKIGCHVLQGYYFAKPMSAKELTKSECFSEIIKLI